MRPTLKRTCLFALISCVLSTSAAMAAQTAEVKNTAPDAYYTVNQTLIANGGEVTRENDKLHIKWDGMPQNANATITWYDAEKNQHQTLVARAENGHVVIADPNPNRRTFFIVTNTETGKSITLGERKVPAAGMDNFRDMGGYQTVDGKTTKWGKIYRADTFYKLKPAGYDYVLHMNMGHIFDLRKPEEINKKPDPALQGVSYHHTEIPDKPTGYDDMKWDSIENIQSFSSSPKAFTYYLDANRFMTEDAESHNTLKAVFNAALNADGKGLVWHCAGGKDRTGFISAVFLSVLGVPEETILSDYVITNDYRRDFDVKELQEMRDAFSGSTKEQALKGFLAIQQARPEYIQAGLTAIKDKYGSVERYLIAEAGLSESDLKKIKELYTE